MSKSVIRRWCADCESNVATRKHSAKIGIPLILAATLFLALTGGSVTAGDESLAARGALVYLSVMLLGVWTIVNLAWLLTGKFKLSCNKCGRTNLSEVNTRRENQQVANR